MTTATLSMSHMAKQKFHQFHGLQVKICASVKYTNKQQADTTMKRREEVKAAVWAHVPSISTLRHPHLY